MLRLGVALALVSAVACGGESAPAPDNDRGAINEGKTKDGGSKKADAKVSSSDDDSTDDDDTIAPDDGDEPKGGGASDAAVSAGGSVDTAWCKVKAVFDAKCVSCHDGQGGGGSPMGLTSYDEATADATVSKGKKVYQTVGTRVHSTTNPMPPKGGLTADQLAAVDAWIADGASAGDNPGCIDDSGQPAGGEPPAPVWPPAECDAVYKILAHGTGGKDTPQVVPPGQEVHPQVTIDAPWGSDAVQAIAFHPITDNKKVLHHWILYSQAGAFLTGWAPGDDERSPFPSDVGMDMPTGAGSMRLDLHYFNTTGTVAENDNSGLEVCVVTKEHARKNHAAVTMSFSSFGPVLAPAGAVNKPSTGTCRVTASSPVHLLTASPHAHQYANHMKFTVTKKDGSTVVMHDQDFRFGEQGSYPLAPQVILETGDTVTTSCFYTNPTNRNITFGESTTNEMCFNFAVYYPNGALSCGLGLGGGGSLGGFGIGN